MKLNFWQLQLLTSSVRVSQWMFQFCRERLDSKNFWFCLFIRLLIVRNFWIGLLSFLYLRSQTDSSLWIIVWFVPSTSHFVCTEKFDAWNRLLNLSSDHLFSEKSNEMLVLLIYPCCFSITTRFFFNEGFSRQPKAWKGGTRWNNHLFDLCIRILLVKNSKKIWCWRVLPMFEQSLSVTTGVNCAFLNYGLNWKLHRLKRRPKGPKTS